MKEIPRSYLNFINDEVANNDDRIKGIFRSYCNFINGEEVNQNNRVERTIRSYSNVINGEVVNHNDGIEGISRSQCRRFINGEVSQYPISSIIRIYRSFIYSYLTVIAYTLASNLNRLQKHIKQLLTTFLRQRTRTIKRNHKKDTGL